LTISQAEYVIKVLRRINMADVKPVNVSLRGHFNLSEADSDDRI